MRIEAHTASEMYRLAVNEVITHGEHVSPRGIPTREIRGASMVLRNPGEYNLVDRRGMNFRFAVAEFLWILTGQNSLDMVSKFNGVLKRFSDDGHTLQGAYGPPFCDQLPWVIQQLQDDQSSRQAVLTLWRPRPGPSKDIPCTLSMQFLVRNERLDMMATMRSNDAWLGLPYDLFVFTMIQRYVADALDLRIGNYHHHVGSFHIYERDLGSIQDYLHEASRVDHDTSDLVTTYPYSPGVLEALVSAPDAPLDMLVGDPWATVTDLLIPSRTPTKWRRLIEQFGVEPRGFKDYA